MHHQTISYLVNDTVHEGFLAYSSNHEPMPLVLVVHDWSGCNAFAKEKAEYLASLGYVGFAVDMYGGGRTGSTNEEKMALMTPILEKRVNIPVNLLSAIEKVSAFSWIDTTRIAAIGFCFGGLCVLDLARSGYALSGVVSFHGLLSKPEIAASPIKARILALHGYDDPMVPPQALNDFCQEMTQLKVDWQVHQYGGVQHAFTNPKANDSTLGTVYHPVAEKRALTAMRVFLEEIL